MRVLPCEFSLRDSGPSTGDRDLHATMRRRRRSLFAFPAAPTSGALAHPPEPANASECAALRSFARSRARARRRYGSSRQARRMPEGSGMRADEVNGASAPAKEATRAARRATSPAKGSFSIRYRAGANRLRTRESKAERRRRAASAGVRSRRSRSSSRLRAYSSARVAASRRVAQSCRSWWR